MSDSPKILGRVLRSSTTAYTVGSARPLAAQAEEDSLPPFGALVKTLAPDDPAQPRAAATYGLVYNVTVEDDPFVRQLVAADVEDEEYIADQRQHRQAPVVISVLVVGHGQGTEIAQRLPPRPPNTLDRLYACNNAEWVRFSTRHDWLRTLLGATDVPADQLLAAALRAAAAAHPPDQRAPYLIGAGRELAKLLALDLTRLEGVLQQMRGD